MGSREIADAMSLLLCRVGWSASDVLTDRALTSPIIQHIQKLS